MMSNYKFSNGWNYTFSQFTDMHNQSFAEYFVPQEMTVENLVAFWRTYQIDASRSVVMTTPEDIFVGLARMGSRGKRAWCGGFGLAREFRGLGASYLLARKMVEASRETGQSSLQLEVLTQNTAAIKAYKKVGLAEQRRLIGLEIITDTLPEQKEALKIRQVPSEPLYHWLLKHDLDRQSRQQHACWTREIVSTQIIANEAYVLENDEQTPACLILQRYSDHISILAFAFEYELTDDELVALLRTAAGNASKIQLYNEPETSPLIAQLTRLGAYEIFSQYEMTLDLTR